MSDSLVESPQQQDAENDIAGKKPSVRTPAKRKSKLEREREESEEIIKSMGGAVEEGGRRTRSSARGSTTTTPVTPVTKKPRVSRGRGKPKKIDVDDEMNDVDEGAQEQPTENENKDDIKENDVSMEADENPSDDIEDKTENDDGNDKATVVDQAKENDTEAVPAVDNALIKETGKSPTKNDIAPKEDAIETSKVETPPSPVKDSPVTRPIEEAAIPDAAIETSAVTEKANEYSHTNNDNDSVDAVIKENKTEESKDDAPSNAEPTIKPTESPQEVAAAL